MGALNEDAGFDLCVLVPQSEIARVIGKAGAGLKEIRVAMGSKIKVHGEAAPGVTTRRVEMSGSAEQLALGFLKVLSTAYQKEPIADVQVMVPTDMAGGMIGKGGANLKSAREATGVKVTVEREPIADPATGVQERLVTFSGDVAQMGMALSILLKAGGGRKGVGGGGGNKGGGGCKGGGGACGGGKGKAIGAYVDTGGYLDNGGGVGYADVGAGVNDHQMMFIIPDFSVMSVVGEGQFGLQRIMQAAECEVILQQGQQGSIELCIAGSLTQCYVAASMIYNKLTEAAYHHGRQVAMVTIVHYVRSEAAGGVLGKGGDTLKEIRASTGTTIDFQRDQVQGHRPCTITGPFVQVLLALEQISQIIEQHAELAPPARAAGGMKRGPPALSNGSPIGVAGGYAGSGGGFNEPGMAPPPKRSRREDKMLKDNGPVIKLLIPDRLAGAVIGKGGDNLKKVREQFQCKLEMLKKEEAPHWTSDRQAIIHGNPENRRMALESVLQEAYKEVPEDVPDCHLKLLVPSKQAGALIGKGGENLKRFREEFGVNLKVERQEMLGDRLVYGQGTLQQILSAAAMILDTTEGLPQQQEQLLEEPPSIS